MQTARALLMYARMYAVVCICSVGWRARTLRVSLSWRCRRLDARRRLCSRTRTGRWQSSTYQHRAVFMNSTSATTTLPLKVRWAVIWSCYCHDLIPSTVQKSLPESRADFSYPLHCYSAQRTFDFTRKICWLSVITVRTLGLRSSGRGGFNSRSGRYQMVSNWRMGDCLRTGKPSRYLTNHQGQISLPSLRRVRRLPVSGVMPYGRWRSVALRWVITKSYRQPLTLWPLTVSTWNAPMHDATFWLFRIFESSALE